MATHGEISLLNSGLRTSHDIASKVDFANTEPGFVRESLFALLLINMKDILMILDKLGHRVSFKDDLPAGIDVTAQVREMRNAICHIGSGTRRVNGSGTILSFGMAVGKVNFARIGDVELKNPYSDDVAFFYGSQRILLVRHIHAALKEALNLAPMIARESGHHWHSIH